MNVPRRVDVTNVQGLNWRTRLGQWIESGWRHWLIIALIVVSTFVAINYKRAQGRMYRGLLCKHCGGLMKQRQCLSCREHFVHTIPLTESKVYWTNWKRRFEYLLMIEAAFILTIVVFPVDRGLQPPFIIFGAIIFFSGWTGIVIASFCIQRKIPI